MLKTIEYIKSLELETGGLAAWAGQVAYPECTGYIIPTLLSYGEKEFAERLGDWLETVQNKDGSFDGLDGVPRSFDTGACYEGLKALGRNKAAEKALAWLEGMVKGIELRIHPKTDECHQYNIRVLGIMGAKLPEPLFLPSTRTHYLAYALEGLHTMGFDISSELKKFSEGKTLVKFDESGGSDTCATAQIAVLCLKDDIPCEGLVEAVRQMVDDDGGVFHGSGDRRKCLWTMKYYLDMEKLIENQKNAMRTSGKIQDKRKNVRKSNLPEV